MPANDYENFRSVLALNLCAALPADQLSKALAAVDAAMGDFEITRKDMDLVAAGGVPEVVKLFIASKVIANASRGTLKQYRYKLVNFFTAVRKPYTDITANDIRLYLYRYKTDHSATDRYLENIRITLNSFFTWLVDNEYLQRNPCAKVEKIRYQEKRREPLTAFQLELFRWNTEDIREKALDAEVKKTAEAKKYAAQQEAALRRYLATRTDDTDALFVSVRAPHHAIGAHALENIIKKVADRTGLHVYPHRLRHTFATSGLHGGMPLHVLQQLMGHVNPRTTLIYAEQSRDDVRHEHQRVYA